MRSFLLKISLMIFISSIFSFCSSQQEIKDIIQPINLAKGGSKTIVVSDLFYSENYNITFKSSKYVDVNYELDKKEITITASNNFSGLTSVEFNLNDNVYSIPILIRKKTSRTFSFKPKENYTELTVFGSFNSWNRHQFPLTDENGDGIFETTVEIDPGSYEYKFYADGKELLDPRNPEKKSNGMGSYNNLFTIPQSIENEMFLHNISIENKNSNSVYNFAYESPNKPIHLTKENVIAFLDNKILDQESITVKNNNLKISISEELLKGKHLLRTAINENGYTSNIQMNFLNDGKALSNNDQFNWYDGIIYSLLIDRFNDGDRTINAPIKFDSLSDKANYMGGDLQGIIDKLKENYFTNLGINTIWISPVMDNPEIPYRESPEPHRYYSGYHGYWPVNNKKVESRFGDMDKLKELVSVAHSKNIKILLDFVSNHVHKENSIFKEHPDWFGKLELPDGRLNLRFWDEYRLTTWFEPYLPSFDYVSSKEAVEYMTDNSLWWLNETQADGFRHDAVKHVPNVFWRRETQKLKKEFSHKRKLHAYQIGETFGGYDLVSSYVNNGQLDAQFNFNLYNVAQTAFIDNNYSFEKLDLELKKTRSVYGGLHLMGNIMDSHDKNRYMTYADGDLQLSQWSAIEEGWNNPPSVDNPSSYKKGLIYYAYMMSIPGLPVIYYGSEFGMTGASDPDNRRMMRFGNQLSSDEKKMLDETSKIINLRNEHTALRFGDYYPVLANEKMFAYIRSDMNERILVVINKSEKTQRAEITFPEEYNILEAIDLVSGNKIENERDRATIMMPGISWKYFLLKD